MFFLYSYISQISDITYLLFIRKFTENLGAPIVTIAKSEYTQLLRIKMYLMILKRVHESRIISVRIIHYCMHISHAYLTEQVLVL